MIPIKDTNPTRNFPYLTIIIIILNVYVFILQSTLGATAQEFFFFNHGVLPRCFIASFGSEENYRNSVEETKNMLKKSLATNLALQQRMRISRSQINSIDELVNENFHRKVFGIGGMFAEIISLFSSMFIHGGIMHLIGNMWFLWIFGNNIEDSLGVVKYLIFYLLCGIFAAFGHILFSLNSIIPTIGASGAISGVLGAYILIYPHARILTFIPIGWFLWMEDLPAYVFLGYWIVIQILFAAFSNPFIKSSGGVAWIAHIAGFFAGVLLVILLKGRSKDIYGQEESESVIELFDEDEDDRF